MSTVMYAYRVPKSKFWTFFDTLKQYYNANHQIPKLIKNCKNFEELSVVEDLFKNDMKITLQLFDFGNDWIFRVLENGYFFMNNLIQFNNQIVTPVSYDNRTDVSDEDIPNEAIAEDIDIYWNKPII